jgi:hypothetical protein
VLEPELVLEPALAPGSVSGSGAAEGVEEQAQIAALD